MHCLPKVVGVVVRVDAVGVFGNERCKGWVDFTQMLQRFLSIVGNVQWSLCPRVLLWDFWLDLLGLNHLDFWRVNRSDCHASDSHLDVR